MREPLLDKLDRKMGRFALKNLMSIIVIGTALVWVFNYVIYLKTGILIDSYINFNKAAILRGQVWRLITFLFVSTEFNPLLLAISLYFYWLIGNALERTWGAFKFNVFYFCGVLCSIGSGFITGYATVYYLNLSLFLAFAILYPNHQVLLFFFIPIKMKWLAIFDLVCLALMMIFYTWIERIAFLVAFGNIALFFTGTLIRSIATWRRKKKWQKGIYVVEDKPKKRKNKRDDDPFEL